MNCTHAFPKTWEFGPIIFNQEDKKQYWWFYKKCIQCEEIEIFPSWKLNPHKRNAVSDSRDLYMVRVQV